MAKTSEEGKTEMEKHDDTLEPQLTTAATTGTSPSTSLKEIQPTLKRKAHHESGNVSGMDAQSTDMYPHDDNVAKEVTQPPTISWDENSLREFRSVGLTQETIDILGSAGYTNLLLISYMSEKSITILTNKHNLQLAQEDAIKALVRKAVNVTDDEKGAPSKRLARENHRPMSKEHKEIITKRSPELCECVKPVQVLVKLHAKSCLTDEEVEHIKNHSTMYAQVWELLWCLRKGSDNCFEELCKSLISSNQSHAAGLLKPEILHDMATPVLDPERKCKYSGVNRHRCILIPLQPIHRGSIRIFEFLHKTLFLFISGDINNTVKPQFEHYCFVMYISNAHILNSVLHFFQVNACLSHFPLPIRITELLILRNSPHVNKI